MQQNTQIHFIKMGRNTLPSVNPPFQLDQFSWDGMKKLQEISVCLCYYLAASTTTYYYYYHYYTRERNLTTIALTAATTTTSVATITVCCVRIVHVFRCAWMCLLLCERVCVWVSPFVSFCVFACVCVCMFTAEVVEHATTRRQKEYPQYQLMSTTK